MLTVNFSLSMYWYSSIPSYEVCSLAMNVSWPILTILKLNDVHRQLLWAISSTMWLV